MYLLEIDHFVGVFADFYHNHAFHIVDGVHTFTGRESLQLLTQSRVNCDLLASGGFDVDDAVLGINLRFGFGYGILYAGSITCNEDELVAIIGRTLLDRPNAGLRQFPLK